MFSADYLITKRKQSCCS